MTYEEFPQAVGTVATETHIRNNTFELELSVMLGMRNDRKDILSGDTTVTSALFLTYRHPYAKVPKAIFLAFTVSLFYLLRYGIQCLLITGSERVSVSESSGGGWKSLSPGEIKWWPCEGPEAIPGSECGYIM